MLEARKFANRQARISIIRRRLIESAIWLIRNSRIAERELELPSPFIESLNRQIGIVGNSRIAERESVLTGSLIESAIR